MITETTLSSTGYIIFARRLHSARIMFDLEGKVALVTGAATGIGLACVKELLRNKLKGVALIDVSEENGQKALAEVRKEFGTHSAIFVKTDVSDKKQLEDAFEKTVNTFNQLDIVFNNAGIVQEIQWEKCIAINLTAVVTGSMLAMEKYFPKYKSGPEAMILNTASLAAINPTDGLPTYSATKAGVVTFSRTLGSDMHYKKTAVRVVAICPGYVDTAILDMNDTQVFENGFQTVRNDCQNAVRQRPEDLAKKAIGIIKTAPSGTAWAADGDTCTQIHF